ncbi:hypothetical protein F5Y16DRAFT_374066 [Xylariaceae sp. FL0255]|nr:hypothetical protein F5Y16DRAFT_374066 [Xylariaceae sp. FL0255]
MAISDRPPTSAFVARMRRVYNPVGFSKGYNFILWFIFGGAFFAFILARLEFLDIDGVFCNPNSASTAAPGECFYWLQNKYRVGVLLHLGTILPAGLLACIQFTPVIRHKVKLLHRMNGYIVITLCIISSAAVLYILPVSFGGDIVIQAGGGVLAFSFLGALVMAYINIKRLQIDQHRAWMLRAWFWAGSIITLRLILFSAAAINSFPRYYAMPCDKIHWILGGNVTGTVARYPECASFFSGENIQQHAAIRAAVTGATSAVEAAAAVDSTFGMALFVAFLLHIIGVEIYLTLTPAESERLRQFSYERQLKAGMRNPGSAGLTSDRLGDAKRWAPQIESDESNSQSTEVRNRSDSP